MFAPHLFAPHCAWSKSTKPIEFKAADGLTLSADLYAPHAKEAPFIVLFHQAGWSRGEYKEIAPKLNAMGFNCMAVDQRSGGKINGVVNQTNLRAKKLKKGTSYVDAMADVEAAIAYVKEKQKPKKLIIWGSSYSSALVLRYAGTHPGAVDGVLSFAPGEYFEKLGQSKTWIQDAAKDIEVPVFITSAKAEKSNWANIYNSIKSKDKSSFLPTGDGQHGSRALWKKFPDHKNYWEAVTTFLKRFKTH